MSKHFFYWWKTRLTTTLPSPPLPLCVHSTRPRVYVQYASVYASITRTCWNMTHGDVLSGHTGFSACHTAHTNHTPHSTHTTTQDTTCHNTPQQPRPQHLTKTETERDRDRQGQSERQRKKTQTEERREKERKREDSFSVWWCMAVFSWCSALSCSSRQWPSL